jgi:nucleoid DNA-binding protein
MTKRDIVVAISSETNMVQQDVARVVQRTLELIREAVSQGKTVELRNFGVFEVKVRKARIGRNPNAPEKDVRIPPRSVVKFKPGKEMRDEVLKLSPEVVEGARAGNRQTTSEPAPSSASPPAGSGSD